MSDASHDADFEAAFHRSAERHERVWVFIAIVMLALLLVGSMFFVVLDYGVIVRTAGFQADPAASPAVGPAADAGLVRTGPNAYAVHMQAHLWAWTPSPLHIPQGATVTFYVTSSDVLHGFEVQGTTINVTAVPGITGTVTYTFDHVGIYNIICNEYCGIEHQAMIGRIVIDPARPA
ncbi:MAG TPA: cytochrome c oxidase subunit II [Rhodopila sp.]|uniref:cytochrome c oxidase subunit II n=1 Tax=Rhodopila sp. TaxID=2480087 RepID=UPI002C4DFAEC|nr:cytochrome c oxidase subunit II [Rhodopila sp.]HVY16176.1 cytochrome c oxidase subunit II [Rhodopila sp.]